ncbi:hypothetical protein D9M68_800380 [compost metagenome]
MRRRHGVLGRVRRHPRSPPPRRSAPGPGRLGHRHQRGRLAASDQHLHDRAARPQQGRARGGLVGRSLGQDARLRRPARWFPAAGRLVPPLLGRPAPRARRRRCAAACGQSGVAAVQIAATGPRAAADAVRGRALGRGAMGKRVASGQRGQAGAAERRRTHARQAHAGTVRRRAPRYAAGLLFGTGKQSAELLCRGGRAGTHAGRAPGR